MMGTRRGILGVAAIVDASSPPRIPRNDVRIKTAIIQIAVPAYPRGVVSITEKGTPMMLSFGHTILPAP